MKKRTRSQGRIQGRFHGGIGGRGEFAVPWKESAHEEKRTATALANSSNVARGWRDVETELETGFSTEMAQGNLDYKQF